MTDDPLMKASEALLMDHLVELRTRLLNLSLRWRLLLLLFLFC